MQRCGWAYSVQELSITTRYLVAGRMAVSLYIIIGPKVRKLIIMNTIIEILISKQKIIFPNQTERFDISSVPIS